MAAEQFKGLLVVIAHSGIVIPNEIPPDSLSAEFPRLMRNVDWYTNWLYDFRDILGNSQLVFPYCNLVLEANRHPQKLDESVPLKDVFGEPVYQPGLEPDQKLRRSLSQKYLRRFHQDITAEIGRGKTFMLDAHSTLTARGVADNQIELMNFQVAGPDGEPTYFCPDVFIESYASELAKLLPEAKVTVNESRYDQVYGHICGQHSVKAMTRVGHRVPAILQETNQKLYLNADRTPNMAALERLRRAFAQALYRMSRKINTAD
jgi:N-formylglutamate amidohydrolase